MRLKIKQFDVRSMKPHRVTYFIGRRGTGKTTLLLDVLGQLADRFDVALAMSPTEDTLQEFRKIVPGPFVFEAMNSTKVDELIDTQRRTAAAKPESVRSAALLWDDLMYERGVMNTTSMRELHFNGRHSKIAFFNSVQYLMDVPPSIRSQVDYVFCCRETIMSNKVKLHKYFFGIVDTYQEFSSILDACTQDYCVLVLDCTQVTSNVEDCLFWYKANPSPPPFRLCRPDYWRWSAEYGKSADEVERERFLGRRAGGGAGGGGGGSSGSKKKDAMVVERRGADGRVLPEDAAGGDVVLLK